MKFRFLYIFTLIVLLLTVVESKIQKREDVTGFGNAEDLKSYIIILKNSLSQEEFENKIDSLTALIGENNVSQVYRIEGFRGLAATISSDNLEKINSDEAVDYIEEDSTVSINSKKTELA